MVAKKEKSELMRVDSTNPSAKVCFNSPTWGRLSLVAMMGRVNKYLHTYPDYAYQIVIGTDSAPKNRERLDYITAVVVHRIGAGGIYFWHRTVRGKVHTLRERMYEEALLSLEFAKLFLESAGKLGLLHLDLAIHVDIGRGGPTREMISEVVGMIRGSGFEVRIKPEAFAASKVADRHT